MRTWRCDHAILEKTGEILGEPQCRGAAVLGRNKARRETPSLGSTISSQLLQKWFQFQGFLGKIWKYIEGSTVKVYNLGAPEFGHDGILVLKIVQPTDYISGEIHRQIAWTEGLVRALTSQGLGSWPSQYGVEYARP